MLKLWQEPKTNHVLTIALKQKIDKTQRALSIGYYNIYYG